MSPDICERYILAAPFVFIAILYFKEDKCRFLFSRDNDISIH